jgi:hypothetical protein
MSATNRGSIRIKNDSYQTPIYSIDSLLNVLRLENIRTFTEPCRGDGNIYNKINCENKYYCEIEEDSDYLKKEMPMVDLIITNPPYSLAKEFIEKSLKESYSVWYLLRINFLASLERSEWWQDKLPTHLLVLSARPSFMNKGTDATEYAWFGWDNFEVCKLDAGIHVLPYLKYKK